MKSGNVINVYRLSYLMCGNGSENSLKGFTCEAFRSGRTANTSNYIEVSLSAEFFSAEFRNASRQFPYLYKYIWIDERVDLTWDISRNVHIKLGIFPDSFRGTLHSLGLIGW